MQKQLRIWRKQTLSVICLLAIILQGILGQTRDFSYVSGGIDPVTGLYYGVIGSTSCHIRGIGQCTEKNLVIPSEINGYTVTLLLLDGGGGEGLESLTIPAGVSVHEWSFYSMQNLKAIYTEGNEGYYAAEEGVLFNKEKTSLIKYPAAKENSAYSVPSTVVGMEYKSFAGCSQLKTLNIPTTNIQAPTDYWDESIYDVVYLDRLYIHTGVQDIFFLNVGDAEVDIQSIVGDGWSALDDNDFHIHYGFGLSRQPVSASVTEGEEAVFEAEAVGEGLTFRWEYKPSETEEWTECGVSENGYNTEKLTVTAGGAMNGWQYRLKTIRGEEINYSDEVMLTVKPAPFGWKQNSRGWWYQREDGTYPVNQWEKIDGKWYHFDAKGYRQTGWLKLSNKWYYLAADGVMTTGWQKLDGKWYYMNQSGAMQTGWKQISDKWYYFSESGTMASGWKQISEQWYYFASGGAMQTGWQKISNKQYYFKSSGVMAAKEWCSGYYLNADGSWTYQYRAFWKQNAKGWWFGDDSGWYAKNCTIIIDGKNYTFDGSGYWVK